MDGLIILDSTGRPVIQSNFRNHPSSYPLTHVDAFNDAQTKVQSKSGQGDGSLDPVLYVSATAAPSICCHMEVGGLRIICPASRDVDPLYIFAFMNTFVAILREYVGEVSLHTLKEHFDVVYQLLEEMLDDGIPLTTESNTLRDIVLPPTFFNKILNVTGVSGLSNASPTPFSSPIPWRRANVKHNKNEIYFDITEDLDAMIARNGTLLSAEIWGSIKCEARLSGTPDMALSFTNAKIFSDTSFHSCVRLQRFSKDSTLSFVPPDGNFPLMDYRVSPAAMKKTSALGTGGVGSQIGIEAVPLSLKSTIDISERGGSFTLTLTPRPQAMLRVQALEQVSISVSLGSGTIGANCSLSYASGGQGAGGMRDREKEERASGSWAWEPKEKVQSHFYVPDGVVRCLMESFWPSDVYFPDLAVDDTVNCIGIFSICLDIEGNVYIHASPYCSLSIY
ncbi:hypothetical protein FRB98_005325 [Tulasnella sp. 332]|nr:hypothetical protein FRB98_005325 [Tulasnella sp. 332]